MNVRAQFPDFLENDMTPMPPTKKGPPTKKAKGKKSASTKPQWAQIADSMSKTKC